ncbi:MAG: hypothetical protein JO056_09895 [Alphaproteobacteria bacterium]|nr:hypothetical protein [Alphaproteobacteria bacterium]
MKKVILVVGMHRSGTSALTGTLVEAGAAFGDTALAAGGRPENPLGLVERTDFMALSERALRLLGCSWHDLSEFRPNWDNEQAASIRENFRNTVLADLLKHEVSILKDPRLCFLLPLFLPAIPNPAAVLIVRHPGEVALSLQARNGFPLPFGVALWEAYNRQALLSLQNVPGILVHHRRLLRDTANCIEELVAGLARLDVRGLNAEAAVGHIRPMLHHHRGADAAETYELSRGQRRFWRQLRDATELAGLVPGELSAESAEALRLHHINPILPLRRGKASPGKGSAS